MLAGVCDAGFAGKLRTAMVLVQGDWLLVALVYEDGLAHVIRISLLNRQQ